MSLPIALSPKLFQISLATYRLAVESILADQIETRIPSFADGNGKIDEPHRKLGKSVGPIQRRQNQGVAVSRSQNRYIISS